MGFRRGGCAGQLCRQQALRGHARQFPASQTLHYVCDNYSSHSSETFCQAVAQLCGLDLPPLPTLAQRRQWLQSPAKRIVFHFLAQPGRDLAVHPPQPLIRSVIDAVSLPDSKCKDPAKLARRISSMQERLHTLFSDLLQHLGLCSKAA